MNCTKKIISNYICAKKQKISGKKKLGNFEVNLWGIRLRYKKLCYICGVKSCHEIESKLVGNWVKAKARRVKALNSGWLAENDVLQAEERHDWLVAYFIDDKPWAYLSRESAAWDSMWGDPSEFPVGWMSTFESHWTPDAVKGLGLPPSGLRRRSQ